MHLHGLNPVQEKPVMLVKWLSSQHTLYSTTTTTKNKGETTFQYSKFCPLTKLSKTENESVFFFFFEYQKELSLFL